MNSFIWLGSSITSLSTSSTPLMSSQIFWRLDGLQWIPSLDFQPGWKFQKYFLSFSYLLCEGFKIPSIKIPYYNHQNDHHNSQWPLTKVEDFFCREVFPKSLISIYYSSVQNLPVDFLNTNGWPRGKKWICFEYCNIF